MHPVGFWGQQIRNVVNTLISSSVDATKAGRALHMQWIVRSVERQHYAKKLINSQTMGIKILDRGSRPPTARRTRGRKAERKRNRFTEGQMFYYKYSFSFIPQTGTFFDWRCVIVFTSKQLYRCRQLNNNNNNSCQQQQSSMNYL